MTPPLPTGPNLTLRMICRCGHSLSKHGFGAPMPCEHGHPSNLYPKPRHEACECAGYEHSHDT